MVYSFHLETTLKLYVVKKTITQVNLTKSLQYIIYFLKTAYIAVEYVNSEMYSSWYGHVLNAAIHSYSSRSGNLTDLHVSRVGPLSENLRLRDIVVTWWKGAEKCVAVTLT